MNTVPLGDTPVLDTLRNLGRPKVQSELDRVRKARSELDTYEALLQLALQLNPEEASDLPVDEPVPYRAPAATGKPTLRQAVVGVMVDGQVWRPTALLAELRRREWAPVGKNARNQLSNRLADLVERGEVEKLGKGEYRLVIRPQEPPGAPSM